MATKAITPGTTGNLQTDLGGAPSAADIFHLNNGSATYTTVPDWSGTAVDSIYIGPGFSGNINSTWGLQLTGVLDNAFSGKHLYASAVAATINEVRHQPSAGGTMYLQSGVGGVVTNVHTWGPMVLSAETVTNLYAHEGKTTVQTGAVISGTFSIDRGAECIVERDFAAASISGTLIMNSTSITPSGTTTVNDGGTLKIIKSGTWTATTAVLLLKKGATLDCSLTDAPFVFEDFTHEAGAFIIKRKGTTPYTIAGTGVETALGGGATVVYV